jgi:uncharacterized protein YcbK (DUF882 family)
MKVSKHFNREEFACKCGCGLDTVDVDLLKVLEIVREHFGKPVIINSACRCADHNKSIGGASKSYHVKCQAADIVVKDVPSSQVQEFLQEWIGGLGCYSTFTHIDVGPERRWWT